MNCSLRFERNGGFKCARSDFVRLQPKIDNDVGPGLRDILWAYCAPRSLQVGNFFADTLGSLSL